MLSFSTCWNSHRHTDGEILAGELRDLGFTNIELGQNLRICLLPGIKRLHKRGRIKISSLHNFCPQPLEPLAPPSKTFDLASPNAKEQETAVNWTRQTVDYAHEFGAGFVVVHLGRTGMEGFTESLYDKVRKEQLFSSAYVQEKLRGIQRRAKESDRFLERAKTALEAILPHARERNVKIGIESRGEYEEGPNETEMIELMREYKGEESLGYWHDFGQIQKKANLGLLDHGQWLEEMQPYVLGCHVHDLRWPDETHRVPFSGMIPFDQLMSMIPKGAPVVWELNRRCRKADIKQAFPSWDQQFVKRPA